MIKELLDTFTMICITLIFGFFIGWFLYALVVGW